MIKKIAFSLILSLCLLQVSLAQDQSQQADSLLNVIQTTDNDSIRVSTYFGLAQLNLYTNPQKTVQLCREMISLCERIEDYDAIANAFTLIYNAQRYYGASADTMYQTIQRLEEHVNTHLDERYLLNVYWIYGLYYDNIKQIDKEIEVYIKALEIARKYEMGGPTEGALLGNIGNILHGQGKFAEAREYLEMALELVADEIGRGSVKHSLGSIYNAEEEYTLALQFFEESYEHFEASQDFLGMSLALIDQGKHYDRIGYFEEANRIFVQASDLVQTNDIGSALPFLYVSMAEHYQLREDYRAAIQFGEQALAESEYQENYNDLEQIFTTLQECYVKVGDYQKAYEIRGQELLFKDSVNNAELQTNVEALQTEFRVEQKESENKLLKAQAAANEKTLQNRSITALALLLGCLLLFSWAFTVYRSNRRKQKYNEELKATVSARTSALEEANKDLLQANHELNTFNHIASHDIKEPMRSIGNHVGLIYRMLPEDIKPGLKDYFDTIKSSTSQLYTVIEDFSKYTQLSKDDDFTLQQVDLNQLVKNLKMGLNDYTDQKNAKIINQGLVSINTNTSIIYIILKNLVENGLKFNKSPEPTVTLSSRTNGQSVEILVQDNGIGIEPAYREQVFDMFKRLNHRTDFEGSGIGLAIVKLLTDKLGGGIKIESELGQGSTFILQLPTQKSGNLTS